MRAVVSMGESNKAITHSGNAADWPVQTIDQLIGDHLMGSAGRLDRAVSSQHQNLIAKPEDMVWVVRTDKSRPAIMCELTDRAPKEQLITEIQTGRRLIKQEQPCVLGESAGKEYELTLTSAQRSVAPL